jgi:hypothetical protein
MAEIDFMNLTPADIVERLVVGVEDRIGESLFPGDERRLFLEALAPVMVQLIEEVNDACRQRLLRYPRY